MNTIFQIAVILIATYVVVEVATLVYILRYRSTAVPRIRYALRSLLGLDRDRSNAQDQERCVSSRLDLLDKKINYVGRHIKFEREQLRRMGILKDETAVHATEDEPSILRLKQ
jgi:hypothetical protein